MKHIVKNIHFVGIGGVGMSGIAEVLLTQGYKVSGSDKEESVATKHLCNMGAKIFYGHRPEYVLGVDVVVVSSAIHEKNCEVLAARKSQIPIVPRAVMLAELMRLKQGIAIAGTHGKTTTTSLVSCILAAGGFDPTYVIGGRLTGSGTNASLGSGVFIVAEADESDASFLNLSPVIEVITNIDSDHMDCYSQEMNRLKQAFVDFAHRLPFYGIAVVCVDDHNVQEILPSLLRPTLRYGLSEFAQIRAINLLPNGRKMEFTVLRPDMLPLQVTLNLPGKHNVQNALAAIAIATELEIPNEVIQDALLHFKGVGRRFQYVGEIKKNQGNYTLIDDYAHHPSEIEATILAAKGAYPNRRIVVAFQPHRYTRTRDCFEDLVQVLSQANFLFLSEVYSAGEDPIVAADGRALARAIRTVGKVELIFIENIQEMGQAIHESAKEGDVILTMGAGSIGKIVIDDLRRRK